MTYAPIMTWEQILALRMSSIDEQKLREAVERVRKEASRRSIDAELEGVVLSHLQPELDTFTNAERGATPSPDLRRIMAATTARDNQRRFVREADDLGCLLAVADLVLSPEFQAIDHPDAHLIASAPALYEALENLIEATYYCLFGLRGNAECSEDDMYGEARSALAQARGERP